MSDVRPLVHLANAIAKRWPAGRRLEFVHAPLAAAAERPPNRLGFYQPLTKLHLDPAITFVAGFVHEQLSREANRALHAHLHELLHRPIGVATSCGLGRRERDAALEAMNLTADLCADVAS